MKKLELQLSALQVSHQKPSKKAGSIPIDHSDTALDLEVSRNARRFSLLHSPWVDIAIFSGMNGRPDVDPTSPSCFVDEESMLQGTRAELYDTLPLKLHDAMENSASFVSVVCPILHLLFIQSHGFTSFEMELAALGQVQLLLFVKLRPKYSNSTQTILTRITIVRLWTSCSVTSNSPVTLATQL